MTRLLIIGYGNMAGAMLDGWLASGIEPKRFAILNRSPKPAPEGVQVHADIAEDPYSNAAIRVDHRPGPPDSI